MTLAGIIYTLCALTAAACAFLLLQGYRRSGYRLLLWGGVCFALLTFSNIFLVADKVLFPEIDFASLRTLTGLGGMLIFLYGLIWDAE